jgi:hypothetical protein
MDGMLRVPLLMLESMVHVESNLEDSGGHDHKMRI